MICNICGSVIKDGSKFCPICGGAVSEATQGQSTNMGYSNEPAGNNQSNSSSSSGSSGAKTAVIVILLLAIVGIVAYFLIQNNASEDGDDTVDVNPFEYLTVNFSGVDGNGTVDYYSNSTVFTTNYFSAGSQTTNLSNGNTITIVFDRTSFESVHPEYYVALESMDYQVIGLSKASQSNNNAGIVAENTTANVIYDYSLPSDLQVPGSANGYILPDSDSRKYSESELTSLTSKQLRYARNEITARHGRMFSDELLQSYFDARSWYYPQYEPEYFDKYIHESALSSTEKHNMDVITKIEDSRKK